jgi:hypothetical protein
LASRVGLTRQEVDHDLRTLETHGLVCQVDSRRWGGLTQRLPVATAASYVVSPAALGAVAADPERSGDDRLSARYLVVLAAGNVGEVGALVRGAAPPASGCRSRSWRWRSTARAGSGRRPSARRSPPS